MKTNYILLVFLGLSTYLNCEGQCQEFSNALTLEVFSRGNYNFPISGSSHKTPYYCLFDVSLINKSDKRLEFLTFTCSPTKNLVVDSKNYKICMNICVHNTIYPIKLEPGQRLCISVILETDSEKLNDSIRIGWLHLNYENTKDVFDFYDKLKQAEPNDRDIIWSKKTYLGILDNQPLEMR